jgi:hypothetical protein
MWVCQTEYIFSSVLFVYYKRNGMPSTKIINTFRPYHIIRIHPVV